MRLGYMVPGESVTADTVLVQVARLLLDKGLRVAGAIQHNHGAASNGRCHMDLEILTGERVVRISQDLGPHARGCRLDPGALEEILREELRRRRVDGLFAGADRLAGTAGPAMTEAEVEAEVQAARAARRNGHAPRA